VLLGPANCWNKALDRDFNYLVQSDYLFGFRNICRNPVRCIGLMWCVRQDWDRLRPTPTLSRDPPNQLQLKNSNFHQATSIRHLTVAWEVTMDVDSESLDSFSSNNV
jgi:hypothetical protein